MSLIVRCTGVSLLMFTFALLAPVWTSAQDTKDEPAKKDDTAKKDDKKGKDTKDKGKGDKAEPKPKPPPPEKVAYESYVVGKVKKFNAEMMNDITIEVIVPDPVKVNDFQQWQYQQMVAINQAKPQDRPAKLYSYNIEYAKRAQNIYSPKDYDLKVVENVKVRTFDPPMEFDDKGFPKQWTQKELAALRGNTTLPGYPSTLEFVRVGQDVTVYLVKTKVPPRKLGESPMPDPPPSVVMILIGPQMK